MRSGERDYVGALQKGLAVIEALGASEARLSLSEVARSASLTRAAARRYLLTLARLGYAEFDGGRFSLTPHVLRLGYAYFSSASLPRLAQPIVERIGERTHEVASIAVLDGAEILFLARSARRRIISASTGVGTRMPAYCTAIGRVLLAARADADIERFLKDIRPKKFTPRTLTGQRDLLQAILGARREGYAISDEELEIGLRSIAVPVADSRGQVRLAMSVSLQAARMTPAQMTEHLLPELRAGAAQLSTMI
ncbi:MAG: helix-turn-helix domain-containing protein [Burkholderiales bacterium]|nr:helix-turn-helix domain-containing protein [Burkholderiales bacterium]